APHELDELPARRDLACRSPCNRGDFTPAQGRRASDDAGTARKADRRLDRALEAIRGERMGEAVALRVLVQLRRAQRDRHAGVEQDPGQILVELPVTEPQS